VSTAAASLVKSGDAATARLPRFFAKVKNE